MGVIGIVKKLCLHIIPAFAGMMAVFFGFPDEAGSRSGRWNISSRRTAGIPPMRTSSVRGTSGFRWVFAQHPATE